MPSAVVLQMDPWPDTLSRLTEFGRAAERAGLDVAFALVVMLVGWAIASVLSMSVRWLLRRLRFDAAARWLLGSRAVAAHEPASVAAWAINWVIMATAAVLALDALGLRIGAAVAGHLGEVLPRIVTSGVLFVVGSLIALLVGAITRRFLESAGLRAARPYGQVVGAVLTGFAALVALEQLGFAAQFVMALGLVAAGAAGLGLALAFGLGCRDLARDFLVEYLRSLERDDPERPR
jgi:hypothetical protein